MRASIRSRCRASTEKALITLDVIVADDRRPRLRVRHSLPLGTVIVADVSAGEVGRGTALATDGR